MGPVVIIAAASALLSMASDRKSRELDYLIGKRSALIPAPGTAWTLLQDQLGDEAVLFELHIGFRSQFDGDGFDIAWEGVALYQTDKLISHQVIYKRVDGKWRIDLVSGNYDDGRSDFLDRFDKRIRKEYFRVEPPESASGDVWMPAPLIVAGLVRKELRLRDPEIEIHYVVMGPKPLYEGVNRDIAWVGKSLYRAPGEDGSFACEFTLQASQSGWTVHLLTPEKHYDSDAGNTDIDKFWEEKSSDDRYRTWRNVEPPE